MDEITKELLDALKTIERWNSHTTAYAVDFGSNGVRDFYRAIARQSIAKAEAILAATQPDDGWIPWEGGWRPVGSEVVVTARFRFGGQITTPAKALKWFHAYDEGDIIAYRVVKP